MDYKSKTDEEIVEIAKEGIIRSPQGAQAEMMRRLKDSIVKLDISTSRYNRMLVRLTYFLLVIAIFQLWYYAFDGRLNSLTALAGLLAILPILIVYRREIARLK